MDKFETYWEDIQLKYSSYWRIITDRKIQFPRNHHLLNCRTDVEISDMPWNKHPNKGWGKPDKIIGDVEIFYLWKNLK